MRYKTFIFLSVTWGGLLTFFGLIVYAAMRALGHTPRRHGHCVYFELGLGWGGLEFGPVFLVNRSPGEYILDHELGHGYQNCLLGPFFLIIMLASAVRYNARKIKKKLCPKKALPPYDSVWFESWATRLGRAAMGRREA